MILESLHTPGTDGTVRKLGKIPKGRSRPRPKSANANAKIVVASNPSATILINKNGLKWIRFSEI